MTTYIALLRAVNVGGTGKLPMAELQSLCVDQGFDRVETYIASGNVVFDCDSLPRVVQAKLEKRLRAYAAKAIGVFVRTAAEMRTVLENNPFQEKDPRLTYVFFLNEKPDSSALDGVRGRDAEEIRLGKLEIYVHYPKGMGQSKLRIPAATIGTARNLKTIAKLVALSSRGAVRPGD